MEPEAALTETLHLRVTRAEADAVYLGAVRSGLSTSVFLRLALRHVLESASFRVKGGASVTKAL